MFDRIKKLIKTNDVPIDDIPKGTESPLELKDIQSLIEADNQNNDIPMPKWYYISDLHLMHKIQRLKDKSELTVKQMIDQMIEEMLPRFPQHVLIGGDISSDYRVFKALKKQFKVRAAIKH